MTFSKLAALSLLTLGSLAVDLANENCGDDESCDSGLVMLQVGKQQSISMTEVAVVKETASFKHLENLVNAVTNGKMDFISTEEFVPLMRDITATALNSSRTDALATAAEAAAFIDTDKDNKLSKAELDKIKPSEVKFDEGDVTSLAKANVSNELTGWVAFTHAQGGNTWELEYWPSPYWFTPRRLVAEQSSPISLNGCMVFSFYMPGNTEMCHGYIYSNAGTSGQGMCRCYPYSCEYWKDGCKSPDWTCRQSSSWNYIFKNMYHF